MSPDDRLQPRKASPTTAERERTIAILTDRFAHGELDMDLFEERVTLAHRAQSQDDLVGLIADLSVPAQEPAAHNVELVAHAPERGEAIAIFGGTRRVGNWTVPQRLRVAAFLGGVEIDLREACLPVGTIDIDVTATFGGVQVIVPPWLEVEVHGTAIFGGFEHMERTAPAPDPNVPVVRIHGRAFFGGVSVETRLPGESRRQAHRRRRHHRHPRRGGFGGE